MRWCWMKFPRFCRLSYLVSQCGQLNKEFEGKKDESQLSAKVIDVAKSFAVNIFLLSGLKTLFLAKYPVHKRQGKDLISPFFPPSLMHRESPRPGWSQCFIKRLAGVRSYRPAPSQGWSLSSPFCLPSSGESHQREAKTAQTQTQWITTGDNHQKSRLLRPVCRWWRSWPLVTTGARGQLGSPGQARLMLQWPSAEVVTIRPISKQCENVNCIN